MLHRHYLKESGQLHLPALLPLERESYHGAYWIGGWVGPRAGLDDMSRYKFLALPGLELRTVGQPACSQSLFSIV
jgi:hypothetical protein